MDIKLKRSLLLSMISTLLIVGQAAAQVVHYDEPYIYRSPMLRSEYFPLGYWTGDARINVPGEDRVDTIKKYNFDSIIIPNKDFPSLNAIMNKPIVLQPAPLFRQNAAASSSDLTQRFLNGRYEVDVLSDYSAFRGTGLSYLLVDEPFEISLYDPSRGIGAQVGNWKVTTEDLYVNQHLFLYGYTKAKADEQLTTVAKEWARIYSAFNKGTYDAQTRKGSPVLLSLSGAASRKPTMNLLIRKMIDKLIRDKFEGNGCDFERGLVPSVQSMELLAKWQAYIQISTLSPSLKTMYAQKVKDASNTFQAQIKDDVLDSLLGSSLLSFRCISFVSSNPHFDVPDPGQTLLQYVDQIPTAEIQNYVEMLEPYKILFREFYKDGVNLAGVLTHIYPLRDPHSNIYVPFGKTLPDIYWGFPFQGNQDYIELRPQGGQLEFLNNGDFLAYINRPVGLSAITRNLQIVRDNMSTSGYYQTPLYSTYQIAGSGPQTDDFVHQIGGTDPRNVNADEIRAIIGVAYLSGANGMFGWTDYHTKWKRGEDGKLILRPDEKPLGDCSAGLFKVTTDNVGNCQTLTNEPALDEAGTPRLAGIMEANQDIMDFENYLQFRGHPRFVQVLSETLSDNLWIIKLKFFFANLGDLDSEFWAVMNRRVSTSPRMYAPYHSRGVTIATEGPRYVREARLPAEPQTLPVTSFFTNLLPGQFRVFEVSPRPLTSRRLPTLSNVTITAPTFVQRQTSRVAIRWQVNGLTDRYSIFFYLENGTPPSGVTSPWMRREFLDATFRFLPPSSVLDVFDISVPADWPVSGNKLVLAIEKVGEFHQEVYRFDVNVRGNILATRTDDPSPGQCLANDCSLRKAIIAANDSPGHDTISLSEGVYTLTQGGLDITDDLTIAGAGAVYTIIDGGKLDRVFHVHRGVGVDFNDLTIRNGFADVGGGILAESETTLGLNRSIVSDNTARSGGGIWIGPFSELEVTETTVRNNKATQSVPGVDPSSGGGIFSGGAELVGLTSSTVHGNTSDGSGGGLEQSSGGTLALNNTTIGNNSAADSGGGIVLRPTVHAIIINSTITDNKAGQGGGVEVLGGNLELVNSIIAGNKALSPLGKGPDCFGNSVTSPFGHNILGNVAGCVITVQESDQIANPRLGGFVDPGPPGQGRFPLLSTSSGIDAGDITVCTNSVGHPELATDQLDKPRSVDGTVGGTYQPVCDIGAVEFFPSVNRLVSLRQNETTTHYDPTPVVGAPAGTYLITAKFDNITNTLPNTPAFDPVRNKPIFYPFAEVAALQLKRQGAALDDQPVLLNADGGPGRVGARLTPPGSLTAPLNPKATATLQFKIGLKKHEPFVFFINMLGEVR